MLALAKVKIILRVYLDTGWYCNFTLSGASKMVKKKPADQEFIFLFQYLERLLNWKLWIDKAEELLAGARALEPQVRSLFDA